MELEALMALLAVVVLVVEGIMELHVTISELSWPPKYPWLVGSLGSLSPPSPTSTSDNWWELG